ncbi:MAG: IPTL-CTERM sorting domain-containing protein [Ottowia sp.]|uniref:IPTL-CTERM sorting domain-containing protein n=1 Tax=Ottowia sp. TaxID=1898956 RepID=UPI0039E4BE8E
MHPTTPPLRRAALCAAAFALAALHGQTQAALCTWTGAGGSNATSNPANWDCLGGPAATGDSALFPASAANKTVYHDVLLVRFDNVTIEPGYQASGELWYRGVLTVNAPFTGIDLIANGEDQGRAVIQGTGLAEMGYVDWLGNSPANIQITGGAHGRIRSSTSSYAVPLAVGAGSQLSAGPSVQVGALNVAAGGTLAVSEPYTGAAAGGTVGSLTVTGAATFAAGSTFEYLASTTYAPGHLVAQGGLALNGATLRIVVEDPANPDALGYTRTLAGYSNAALLSGRFAGLPATGALIEASNAPGIWYSISYGATSNPFVQITRVAAPEVPPPGPGGATPVPTLGHAALALLSLLMAGLVAIRKRAARA